MPRPPQTESRSTPSVLVPEANSPRLPDGVKTTRNAVKAGLARFPGDWFGSPHAPPPPIARRKTGLLPDALWWGRAGVGGRAALSNWPFESNSRKGMARPPSLTLPHKGGGNAFG